MEYTALSAPISNEETVPGVNVSSEGVSSPVTLNDRVIDNRNENRTGVYNENIDQSNGNPPVVIVCQNQSFVDLLGSSSIQRVLRL